MRTRKSTQMRDLIERALNGDDLTEHEQRIVMSPDNLMLLNQIREFRRVNAKIETAYIASRDEIKRQIKQELKQHTLEGKSL